MFGRGELKYLKDFWPPFKNGKQVSFHGDTDNFTYHPRTRENEMKKDNSKLTLKTQRVL